MNASTGLPFNLVIIHNLPANLIPRYKTSVIEQCYKIFGNPSPPCQFKAWHELVRFTDFTSAFPGG